MPRTNINKKSTYKSVQVPTDLINLIKKLIPGFYRSHHEAIIDWTRKGISDLIELKIKVKKL
ncbi:MAG: hypothetical protein V3V33_10770 [Candidatus Lokiarchaeia archaeon]